MKTGLPLISVWFGVIMVIVVFAGAIAFAFTSFMDEKLFGPRRTAFVFILLAYGIYRTIRVYQVFKKPNHE